MKWKTVPSNNHLSSDGSWEPLELRNLKKRLGNIRGSCHCHVCELNRIRCSHESNDHQIVCPEPTIESFYSKQINNDVQAMGYDDIVSHAPSESFVLQYTNQDPPAKNQNIIIVCQKPPVTSNIPQYINQSTQTTANNTMVCKESAKKSFEIERAPVVNSGTTTDGVNVLGNILGCFNRELTCPSCLLTFNLLKNGITKTLKDEEVETENKMLSCDKSIDNVVVCLEKTTSFYWKPVLKYTSAWSSDLTSIDSESSTACRFPREVTFTFEDSIYHLDKQCEHCDPVSSELPNPLTVTEIDEVENGGTDDTQTEPELLDNMFIDTIPIEQYIDLIRPPMDKVFR